MDLAQVRKVGFAPGEIPVPNIPAGVRILVHPLPLKEHNPINGRLGEAVNRARSHHNY
jgi:hypothetical protein